jgi:hypothetical protein
MSALPKREMIERELDHLSEEQLDNLLDYIEMMKTSFGTSDYDEARDMTIGIIKGSTDAGQRTKDILRAEFGVKKSHDRSET